MKTIIEKLNDPNKSNKPKKPNKRIQVLKSILEKQEGAKSVGHDTQTESIVNIREDMLESTLGPGLFINDARMVTFGSNISNQATASSIAQSIDLFKGLINKELAKVATLLGIDEIELKAWIDSQTEVPAKTILSLLRSIQSLHLDPLSEEIGFTKYDDGQWQVLITIEGCSKLLNQHPQFNGLEFNQADTLIDGLPEWIECSIYRKDRVLPTTVREYLMEVRGENAIWQKMPRRMLRHRALQQCVRLAIAE
jgi:RecT family